MVISTTYITWRWFKLKTTPVNRGIRIKNSPSSWQMPERNWRAISTSSSNFAILQNSHNSYRFLEKTSWMFEKKCVNGRIKNMQHDTSIVQLCHCHVRREAYIGHDTSFTSLLFHMTFSVNIAHRCDTPCLCLHVRDYAHKINQMPNPLK